MRILGIDIGTQGVRGVVCDEKGSVFAQADCAFEHLDTSSIPEHKEQRPTDWAKAMFFVISKCVKQSEEKIDAVAIDGTSGTVVAIDKNGNELCDAIMYNDARAKKEAGEVHIAAADHEKKHGYVFNASYALPKILWVKNNQPDIYEKTWKFIHQADYAAGLLTGVFDVTDYSNALKTGYDLISEEWPSLIGSVGIEKDKLPSVVAPGVRIANISEDAAEKTGLPVSAVLFAGASDGYASSLAAGLALPGEWATVIGTTMVLKGITKKMAVDPLGRIYSHKHPQGWWLPGGASNVGGRCLNEKFGKENFNEYNKTVKEHTPTGILAYPLTMKGERFPFVNPSAEGFYVNEDENIRRSYAGTMEGVGYAEKLAYRVLEGLGCEVGDTILTSGGACKSAEWLQIRANILNKSLKVPKETDAAMGTAMIAAAGYMQGKLSDAVSSMVSFAVEVEPQEQYVDKYVEYYARFEEECKKRGYIL